MTFFLTWVINASNKIVPIVPKPIPAVKTNMAQATITEYPNGRGAPPVVLDLVNDPRFQDLKPSKVAIALQDVIQAMYEVEQLVSDLPEDDPDKTLDPTAEYGERMFWRGNGANKLLVSRSCVVTVTYDATNDRYVVTKRRPR